MYWVHVSREMHDIQFNGNDTVNDLRKGTISGFLLPPWLRLVYLHLPPVFRRHNPFDPIKDIMDPDFWDVDYRWFTNKNPLAGKILFTGPPGVPLTLSNVESFGTLPNIWLAADRLAKSLYSTVLTDLGQTTASPNILLNETTLSLYTQDFAYILSKPENAWPGPGIGSYEDFKNKTGNLGTSPSVISTKYLCQVPRQKSTGSIIVSVVIANLVFLQALWRLFTLITNAWLTKSHAEGNSYTFLPSLRVF